MSVLTSEAVVLRTWPVHEADLLVSFFTRDYGRLKGMAKAALKSRKRFGGALEPMTLARAWFAERPRQELARLDQLEILRSPLSAPVDQTRMAVLSFYAEVIDEALPERDPQATVFRLLASVLEQTTAVKPEPGNQTGNPGAGQVGDAQAGVAQAQPADRMPGESQFSGPRFSGTQFSGSQSYGPQFSGPWMALTYFSLWMTRLMGLLPDIGHCIVCGDALDAGEVRFNAYADGLFCGVHANGSGSGLSADSWQLAQRMLRAPVSSFVGEAWPRKRGQDLRRFTLQTLERHLERKLKTAEALARLGG